MKPPARIKPWMSLDEMGVWVREAPTRQAYQKRLAIWLTSLYSFHAHQLADMLQVSRQAVWLWIGQYNREGPGGLDRKGRGGRRKALMTPQQEKEILRPFLRQARAGRPAKVTAIKEAVQRELGKKVSSPYVYALLTRHGWARTIAESRLASSSREEDTFTRLSTPWRRKDS